uniref:Uncharacterized protein n=1 Tax=Theropithecus gelada TaxID=9565 RepID=A0A8D2E6Q4_THEGE
QFILALELASRNINSSILFIYLYFLNYGFALSFKLECSGATMAHHRLKLLASCDLPTLASQSAWIIGRDTPGAEAEPS